MAPVINAHKMAMFCMTGQSEFDHVHYPYFYRLVPPDLEESYAMVAIAQQLHYKRIALAFGNDIGSQTFIQPAISALKKAGITLTTNQTLDLKATTFRSEAEAIIQSHPDAIMTEALGAADPTLFSEIKQLNGGKMIPVIGTSAAISPAFFKSAAAAVGTSAFVSGFHADNLVVESTGPAYQAFSKALLSQQGKVPGATGDFTTYLSAPGGVHLYDGINLAALAMLMSKSTPRASTARTSSRSVTGCPAPPCATRSPSAPPRSRPGRRSGTKGRAGRPTSTVSTTRPASSRSIPTPPPARSRWSAT